MDDESKRILTRLQAQCSRREYCSRDVLAKAAKAGLDEQRAAEVLESLKADGFVDDLRYASAFARDKAQLTGWGPVKIRFALGGKGLERSVIDEALGEVDGDNARAKALKLMRTKKKSLTGDPQWRLKLIKFILSRGYEYDFVSKLLPELEVDDSAVEPDL